MVKTFFDVMRTKEEKSHITQLFSKLKIGKESKKNYLDEIANSPILFVTFSCISDSYQGFIENMKIMLRELFNEHYYLCVEMKKQKSKTYDKRLEALIYKYEKMCGNEDEEPNDDDLKTSLTFLVNLLYDHFKKKKVIVLMNKIDNSILRLIDDNIESILE